MKSHSVELDSTVGASAFSARCFGGILGERLRNLWRGLALLGNRPPRRLRLCESLPLGDRRMVAVIEFEGSRFLIGGTSSSLVLLDRIDQSEREPAQFRACEESR